MATTIGGGSGGVDGSNARADAWATGATPFDAAGTERQLGRRLGL